MEKGRLHVLIRGYVQGVFFRASTQDMAERLGLTGWVRNLPDGNVEAVFEGTIDLLKQAAAWCSKGSPGSRVTYVHEEWLEYTGEFTVFELRYGR
ncbi:MAG: acylphosphatase [Nitrospirae bacterium]|nr:acylphosphatase [Nitrospirota bacterium]